MVVAESICLSTIVDKPSPDNIRSNIFRLRAERKQIIADISKTFKLLEAENSKYAQKCSELEQEINDIVRRIRETDPSFDDPIKNIVEDNTDPEADEATQKECKDLYRKISKETHPDVAAQEVAHLFLLAKDAFDLFDLAELQKIWDTVNCGEVVAETEGQVVILLKELSLARQKLQQTKSSAQYKTHVLCTNGDDVDHMIGTKMFLDLVVQMIVALREKRDVLKTSTI